METVASPDCDLLQRLPEPLATQPSDPVDRPLALTLAAAIVFIVAHTAPLLGLSAVGRHASTTIAGGVYEMWQQGEPVGGSRVQLRYQDFTLTGAFSVTGKGNNIQTPFGHYPGYLRLIVKDFDRAGEVAWLVGLAYDFSRLLSPGVRAEFNFAQGTSAISPTKRTPEPDEREDDLTISYRAPNSSRLRGVGFEARGALVDLQGGTKPDYQIRLIINYDIPLL